ncbi:MAG: BLUF domain-containing protein [Planctomycetota bacterium]
MLRRVVYISKAASEMSDFQLQMLASRASDRNATVGITGLLVYAGGWFIQAIEGPKASIDLVLNRIYRDNRHHDIEVLLDAEVRERMFRNWTMGVRNLDLVSADIRNPLLEVMQKARRGGGAQGHARTSTMALLREFQKLTCNTQRDAG